MTLWPGTSTKRNPVTSEFRSGIPLWIHGGWGVPFLANLGFMMALLRNIHRSIYVSRVRHCYSMINRYYSTKSSKTEHNGKLIYNQPQQMTPWSSSSTRFACFDPSPLGFSIGFKFMDVVVDGCMFSVCGGLGGYEDVIGHVMELIVI